MGRESRGVKIEGRVNRGLDLMVVVCFLMLRPKRVKVGSGGGGNGDAMAAADRHDGDDDVDLLLNEPNCCCLLAMLDGAIKASADERR